MDWGRLGAGIATGGLSELGPVGRMLGTKDSEAGQLGEFAQDTMGQSNTNAQAAYDLALQQAIASGAYQGPGQVSTQQVVAPTIQAAATDRTGTTAAATPLAQAYGAGPAAQYAASLAQAQNARGDIIGYDTVQQKVERALPATTANMTDVNTTVNPVDVGEAAQTNLIDIGQTDVGNAGVDSLAWDARDESLAAARAIASGPSAAAAQSKATMDQATADALAAAAQARGSERAAARREALIQMTQKGAQTAEATAALAAQEENAKRTAYAQALQGVRSSDVSVAEAQGQIKASLVQTQAQIAASRENTKAQLNAAIAQGNTAEINKLKQQQAALDLEAQKASVQAGLQQQATGAQLLGQNVQAQNAVQMYNAQAQNAANADNAASGTTAAQYLADAKNTAAREGAQMGTNVSLANANALTNAAAYTAGATNTINQQTAGLATGVSTTNAQLGAAREEANAGRNAQLATVDANNKTQTNLATGNAQLSASTTNAANTLASSTTNASNNLSTQQLKQSGAASGVSGMNTAAGVQGSNAGAIIGAQKTAAEEQTKRDTGLLSAGSSVAAALSDARAKTDIKRVSDKDVDDLAKRLSAYSWRYKNGVEDSGKDVHGGLMAQEVEKSRLGKNFVHADSDGTKRVDVLSIAALMASAAARTIRQHRERSAT